MSLGASLGCLVGLAGIYLPLYLGRYYFSIPAPLQLNLIFSSERTKLSQKKTTSNGMSLGASLGCFVEFAGIYFSEKITAKRAAVLCRIWYVTRGISSLLCSSLVRKSSMFYISSWERTKLSQNKMLQRHLGCLTLLCIWVTRSFLYSPSIISA